MVNMLTPRAFLRKCISFFLHNYVSGLLLGTRYLLISACVMVFICMMFCVISISKCCGTDRKTKILARINVTGTFLQCKRVDLGKQFYLPCIQLEFLTELYQTYNMMISIIIICNEEKSRINN